MSVCLMFGNEMLLSSWFGSAVLCCLLLLHVPCPYPSSTNVPKVLTLALRGAILPVGSLAIKTMISRAMDITDDVRLHCLELHLRTYDKNMSIEQAHIFELVRAKFTSHRSFHPLLYTCAKEFDFLEWETARKTTMTALLPTAAAASAVLGWRLVRAVWRKANNNNVEVDRKKSADPGSSYALLQMLFFAVLAVVIMRLKLLWTPQLCVMAGMLASSKVR